MKTRANKNNLLKLKKFIRLRKKMKKKTQIVLLMIGKMLISMKLQVKSKLTKTRYKKTYRMMKRIKLFQYQLQAQLQKSQLLKINKKLRIKKKRKIPLIFLIIQTKLNNKKPSV